MNKKKLIILICLGIGISFAQANVTLTSADGSKTMEAAIEAYYPAKGTALIKVNGRRLNVPVSAFQSADKSLFDSWLKTKEAGRQLLVTFEENEVKKGEKRQSVSKLSTYETNYNVQIRNNAKMPFENIRLEYRTFYYTDSGKGKQSSYADGQLTVAKIEPRESVSLATTPVKLTKLRPASPSS